MSPKAFILAAGRGERMRPLTDQTPKPLLHVGGKPLVAWHLEALSQAGVREVVINTAWLESQFEPALGDGRRWGLTIRWSHEGRDHGGALETAGGIAKALAGLGEVFWVVSGDVFLPGFAFDLAQAQAFAQGPALAHLWLVPNPEHHPRGDFALAPSGQVESSDVANEGRRLTWASVGLFKAEMFAQLQVGTALPLRPLLDAASARGLLTGQRWDGPWTDVGTPERLEALRKSLG
ncbi:MAG: nucleotidyltransferase family protein [Betaproteobacteria bacterium]|nr:nucleotidyltransferase family protein [Betaproteobacteria bacterium]